MTAGLLLAAGESSRMGRLKALLPWRGTTLIQSQLAEMQAAGLAPLVAVLGHRADELRTLLPADVQPVLNERYLQGKSTSIVTGVAALPAGAGSAVIVAVDQPTEEAILRQLLARYRDGQPPIVLPSIGNRRGHPTLFDRRVFSELLAISEEREGLREVMTRYATELAYAEVTSKLVRTNLNSPEDYEQAFERWGAQAPGQKPIA